MEARLGLVSINVMRDCHVTAVGALRAARVANSNKSGKRNTGDN